MLKSAKRPKVPSGISENISVDLKNQSSISAKADRLINLLVARNKQRLITLPFVFLGTGFSFLNPASSDLLLCSRAKNR
tara:strand:- start:114 stop:350 length:237 start_codon:yes stop_codon:yes gene_type:complete